MKFAIIGVLALLMSSADALAGAGAPVPPIPESSPPSGRPSEVILDEAKCKAIWEKTERVDDALGSDKAAPYITNFHMVDTDGDHKVSWEEFMAGCKNGWVEEGIESRLPTKQISPDVPKE